MKLLADQVNKLAGKLPTLVMVILPTTSADIYMAVKQFGDVHVGVHDSNTFFIRTCSCFVDADAIRRK